MKVKDLQFKTPTVTIYNDTKRFYYGSIENIPGHILRMSVVRAIVVAPINNTNVEVQ